MGNRYRRFFRGPVTPSQLAQLRDALNGHGLDAVIDEKGMLISFSIPLYFGVGHPKDHIRPKPKNPMEDNAEVVIPPVVYFIETGRVPTIDPIIDDLFATWLEQDPSAQAYCSHCYAHFTPLVKGYDVVASTSCSISFQRNNPALAELVEKDPEDYLDSFGVSKKSYYRTNLAGVYDPDLLTDEEASRL